MVWRRQGRASKHNPAMFFCDFTSFCFSFLVHKMYIMIAFRLSLQHETAGENKWINPRGERSTWRPLSREREHRALVTAPPPSAFIHTQGARVSSVLRMRSLHSHTPKTPSLALCSAGPSFLTGPLCKPRTKLFHPEVNSTPGLTGHLAVAACCLSLPPAGHLVT